MCGIIEGFSKKGKKISKSVLKRFDTQKSRGTEGFGYVAVYKDRVSIGRATDEKGIRKQIMDETSGMIMFHHRFPTSTPNIVEATHPIFVSHEELDYDYYVVHNGVIRNATELKKEHESYKTPYEYTTIIENEVVTYHVAKKTGVRYHSDIHKTEKFNDSEAFAIELARYLDGMSRKISAVGTIAFVSYKLDKKTNRLISKSYGHNSGNPLTITENNDYMFLTSVGGEDLPTDIIYTMSTSGKDIGVITEVEIPVGYSSEYEKNGGTFAKPVQSNIHSVTGNADRTDRRFPFPRPDIVKPDPKNFKDKNEMYANLNAYYKEKYGVDKSRTSNWDDEKKVFGFDTTQNEDDQDIDTTGEDFMDKTTPIVNRYLDLEDSCTELFGDIDTAEFMLEDKHIKKDSAILLENEIKEYERLIEINRTEQQYLEDKYNDEYGSTPEFIPFQELVDAHIEQNNDDVNGVKSIYMDEDMGVRNNS